MAYRFILERYKTGGSNRYTCPGCGRRKCFTRYVNTETATYVDESCGKCNHESSCGYHYTPRQYFADHPQNEESWRVFHPLIKIEPPKPVPLMFVPGEYVAKSFSETSLFVRWLSTIVSDKFVLTKVCTDYRIGATRDGAVIFWQIDKDNRVRSGKIMRYSADGHRMGNPNWVHSALIKRGQLPADWCLTQCLFGEHLLAQNPDSMVCLVESEKTAVICACFYPQYIWLSTGGCGNIQFSKLKPLADRHLLVFPDSGEFERWNEFLKKSGHKHYHVSDQLESYAPNTDIADLLLNGTGR